MSNSVFKMSGYMILNMGIEFTENNLIYFDKAYIELNLIKSSYNKFYGCKVNKYILDIHILDTEMKYLYNSPIHRIVEFRNIKMDKTKGDEVLETLMLLYVSDSVNKSGDTIKVEIVSSTMEFTAIVKNKGKYEPKIL